jgi:hypothetical protein
MKSPCLCLTFSSSFELEESTREVKVAEGSTRSGHDLLDLLLLLVPEAVLLRVVTIDVVVLVVVVILVGGVKLHPLGAVGDEVGGVATLEADPR